MGVPDSYMNSVSNLAAIFDAIKSAGVPDRFTREFLKQLGFTSSNDRSVIPLMKALRMLDDNGAPTDRYRRFRDRTISGQVMAEAIRDAYSDVFKVNESAQTLGGTALTGAFSRITGKGDAVSKKMGTTFKSLAGLADFSTPHVDAGIADDGETDDEDEADSPRGADEGAQRGGDGHRFRDNPADGSGSLRMPSLHHDIHVHLPVSTNVKVYDAIFRSLREHLT